MSPWPGAFAVVLALLAFGAGAATLVQHFRARRNERQIAADQALRRGFKCAARMGWLPEDVQ